MSKPLKRGDFVVLRPPSEILATLDEASALDRMPFMSEMLDYYGAIHRVSARAERACDARTRARNVSDTVMLDSVRCSGVGHDGCQAGCLIYWKEAWLRRVESDERTASPPRDEAYERLQQLASSHTRGPSVSATGSATYRCQATELLSASELIPYWSLTSFGRQLTTRNVSLWTFVRTMLGIVKNERRRRTKPPNPFPTAGTRTAMPEPLRLEPGERVRVRSAEEIADTLDHESKLRGLWFDREMVPYCGTSATVKTKVERFIDEHTAEMVELKSDCFILDGVYCKGLLSDGRWFCCRQIYSWWREAWLEREPSGGSA